jgi:small subunit ribosomal protein S25e
MGGVKRRSITSEEKAQARLAEEQAAKQKSEKKGGKLQKREEYSERIKDEKAALSQIKSLKALTLYTVAKALGVTASAANQFLKTLESKDVVVKVGGFSGHYIYKFKDQ